jgi:serine/threonine protein kinase
MRPGNASIRDAAGLDHVDDSVRRFLDQWQSGEPELGPYWARLAADGATVSVLGALAKADLQYRFDRGLRPTAAAYLERFPALAADGERVLSLVYEEFCLREERGEQPDPDAFCAQYAPWTESLASQLRYHRVLSQVAGKAPPPPQYPRLGERFRQFRLTHELGRGGAARVYLALDESLGNREVALKVSADRGSEPAILGRLVHPHIVAVHSVVYQPESHLRGLCMPFRPGPPLDEVIRRLDPATSPPRTAQGLWEALRRPAGADAPGGSSAVVPEIPQGPGWASFPIRGTYAEAVAWIAATLARALQHAHQQRIYHRDVKPANILLTYSEGPQLLDFNLAHDPHSAVQAEAALRGGTLPYMAPEQLEAFLDPARWATVDAVADLYSLGLVVREMLTGATPEPPDPKLPLPRAIQALLDHRAEPGNDLAHEARGRPRLPHSLVSIVGHCLAPSPADRYPDADALIDDLDRFLTHRPLRHAPNPSYLERAANWTRRNAVSLAAAWTVLVVLATVVALNFERLTRPPEAWNEFTVALAALESNQAEKAMPHLEAIARTAPGSPVIALYEAAGLCRLKRADEASTPLARAWVQPSARDALLTWGRSHPSFPRLAQDVGSRVLDADLSNAKPNPRHRAEVLDCAERTFRMVLELEPSSKAAHIGMSAVHEQHGDYPAALAIISGYLNEALTRKPGAGAGVSQLLWYFEVRARIQANWGHSLVDKTTARPDELVRADQLLHATLDDVQSYAGYFPGEPPGSRRLCRVNYIRCEALFDLGLLTERRNGGDEAAQRYEAAAALIDALAPVFEPLGVPEFLDLQRKVLEKRPGHAPTRQVTSRGL